MLKLQALFAQKPNLDSQAGLPHFAVIGMQSSGKTSLLSILAGMHISGPVKASCATRCRVQYDFRASEPGTKTCEVSPGGGMPFEAVGFPNLHRRLEELQGDSFSQKVLHVRICTPTALTCVLNDVPGHPGAAASRDDVEAVKKIWRLIFSDSGPGTGEREEISTVVVPIVIVTPHTSLDVDRMLPDLRSIREAIASDENGQKRTLGRAIALITYLDHFGNFTPDQLAEHRTALVNEGIVPDAKKVIFASMKPHLLGDRNRDGEQCNVDSDSKLTYDEKNALMERALETERANLPTFISRIFNRSDLKSDLKPGDFNFGVQRL